MNKIKAAFFDIDGTLWKRGNPVPDSTIRAIRKFREAGGLAFICTGRSKGNVTDQRLLDIGWDGMIYGCGTLVTVAQTSALDRSFASNNVRPISIGNMTEQEVIHEVTFDNDEWSRIVDICHRCKVRLIIEGHDYLYFDHEDYDDDEYGISLIKELGDTRRTIKENIGNFYAGKFSVDIDYHEYEEEWFAALEDRYNFIKHNAIIYEVVPKGYDKAFGMQMMCEHFGIPLSNVVAFGDGFNDANMLKLAGTGVAMGTAIDDVKAVADYVTTSAEEDGIEKAMIELGMI